MRITWCRVLLPLLIFCAGKGQAQDRWMPITEAGNAVISFNPSGITRLSKGIYRVWIQVVYETVQTDPQGNRYDQKTWRSDYDCARQRRRAVATLHHLEGKIIAQSRQGKPTDWREIAPRTVDEEILVSLCRYVAKVGS